MHKKESKREAERLSQPGTPILGTPSNELRLAYKSPIPKTAPTTITVVFIESLKC